MSDDPSRDQAAHTPAPLSRATHPTGGTPLTTEGRRLLEQRVELLRRTVAELRDQLDDPERSTDAVEGYQRASRELARLESTLVNAETLDDLPDDPQRVELGDWVTIRSEDGSEESYVVVHAQEAFVDDARISADSPLGRALLTRQVGDTVEVGVPGGSYRCTILTATRQHPPS